MYHKMFLFFQYRREESDRHYCQRAQVESTFGSLKQKFSETLASRKFTSQTNEVLCIAIAHNITVLVRQMFETGILPDFFRPPVPTPVPMPELALEETSLCANQSVAVPSVSLSPALG